MLLKLITFFVLMGLGPCTLGMETTQEEQSTDTRPLQKSEQDSIGLTDLPHEKLVEIFDFLDLKSLGRVSQVCRLFYPLTSEVFDKKGLQLAWPLLKERLHKILYQDMPQEELQAYKAFFGIYESVSSFRGIRQHEEFVKAWLKWLKPLENDFLESLYGGKHLYPLFKYIKGDKSHLEVKQYINLDIYFTAMTITHPYPYKVTYPHSQVDCEDPVELLEKYSSITSLTLSDTNWIPPYLCQFLTNIQWLTIEKNTAPENMALSDGLPQYQWRLLAIPKEFSQLQNVTSLTVKRFKNWKYVPEALCALQNLEMLTLNDNGIEMLSKKFAELTNLKELSLRNNYLKILPPMLGKLKNLKKLDMHENKIQKLPETIPEGAFSNLESFFLGMNRVAKVHDWITQLKKLKILDLARNDLKALPSVLAKLENLEELDFNDNKIGVLPETIPEGAFSNLESFYLDWSNIVKVPDWFAQLKKLKILFLAGNHLQALPSMLGKLENLETLNMNQTKIQELPETIPEGAFPNLKHFYLSENGITKVPDWITQLAKIQELRLDGNNIDEIAWKSASISLCNVCLDFNPNLIKLPIFGRPNIKWGLVKTPIGQQLDALNTQWGNEKISTEVTQEHYCNLIFSLGLGKKIASQARTKET